MRLDYADPPSLTFASTPVGSTSTDSPQTVTLENVGNADLSLPVPATGNNPGIATNFTLADNAPNACPVVDSNSSAPGTLAAGASCAFAINFAPTAPGSLSGSLVLTDSNLNAATPGYASQSISLSGTGTQITPTITWPTPSAIVYGTSLGSTQLNATADVAGTFAYSPAAGTILSSGTSSLSVTFTPTDTTHYSTATATVQLTVNQATPTITWPTPSAIVYGTALGSTQLDATANVPGTFAYSPAAGTILSSGTSSLTVTFTPTDTTDYSTATATVQLTVNKATPTIAWPTPASITVGTPLSSTQLDATASVPGTFAYSPGAGTVLAIGSQPLATVFTPTDSADYSTATASAVLIVTPPPSFTLNASPGSLTVARGKSGSVTITVAGQNGFNSSVTLSASGLPNAVTAAFGPNPTNGSSVLTFKASPSAKSGTYPITVNGVSGSLSSSTTISLTVR